MGCGNVHLPVFAVAPQAPRVPLALAGRTHCQASAAFLGGGPTAQRASCKTWLRHFGGFGALRKKASAASAVLRRMQILGDARWPRRRPHRRLAAGASACAHVQRAREWCLQGRRAVAEDEGTASSALAFRSVCALGSRRGVEVFQGRRRAHRDKEKTKAAAGAG